MGDGRCGFRALAHYLGRDCSYVMRVLADCMVSNKGTAATEVIAMLMASDLRNVCPRRCWLNNTHLHLLATTAPYLYPHGIAVRLAEGYVCFEQTDVRVLALEQVRQRMRSNWKPCFLALESRHFVHMSVMPELLGASEPPGQSGQTSCASIQPGDGAVVSPCLVGGSHSADECGGQSSERLQKQRAELPWNLRAIIFQYATCAQNTAAIARVCCEARLLLRRPSFWRGSCVPVPECSCTRPCVSRALRALWPSQSGSEISWCSGSVDSMDTSLPEGVLTDYAHRQVASARFLHAWMSSYNVPPVTSLRLCAPGLFGYASWARVLLGFTRHSDPKDVLDSIFQGPPSHDNVCWLLGFSCQAGQCTSHCTASSCGRTITGLRNMLAGQTFCGENIICLSFAAREFACFSNGELLSACQLPASMAFPSSLRDLRWFCVIEAPVNMRSEPVSTVALPVKTKLAIGTLLPIPSMRLLCFDVLSASDLCVGPRGLVYMGEKSTSLTEVHYFLSSVRAFLEDEGDIAVGFTTARHASSVSDSLLDLRRVPRGTLAVHLCVQKGRVTKQCLLSAHDTLCHDQGQCADHNLLEQLQIRLTLGHHQSLECQVDTGVTCKWHAVPPQTRPQATVLALRKRLPFRDERVAVKCLRLMQLQEIRNRGPVKNIVGNRPWLSGGGSASLPKRSPWADVEDDVVSNASSLQAQTDTPPAHPSNPEAETRAPLARSVGNSWVAGHFRRLLQSNRAGASFLQACGSLLGVDMESLAETAASLAQRNYGWAHFFASLNLLERPLPLYLVQLLLAELSVETVQIWHIHSKKTLLAGQGGVREEAFRMCSWLPTLAVNEQTGRAWAVPAIVQPWPESAKGGLQLDVMVFDAAALVVAPEETIFLCVDLTRLECLSILRAMEGARQLHVDVGLWNADLSWSGLSQLVLSVASRVPFGIVVWDLSHNWWHVSFCHQEAVSCQRALQLLDAGARCVCFCSRSLRWSCVLLRLSDESAWLGSVCKTGKVCKTPAGRHL